MVNGQWVMDYFKGANKINMDYIEKIYDLQEKRIRELERDVRLLIVDRTRSVLLGRK